MKHEPSAPPEYGKIAGIDFGTVRIGVAVCDPERRIAFPHEIYRRRNEKLDVEHFQKLVREEKIVHIVFGLPLHCNGDFGEKARQAVEFANRIADATGLSIDFMDERFTSAIADEYLRSANVKAKDRRQKLDDIAAQIILSTYLDRGCVGTREFLSLDDADDDNDAKEE